MTSAALKYFDDFAIGETIELGSYHVTADEIVEFAKEFDPQDFHLDRAAGDKSILGGLAASGWHVSSILMRLLATGWLNGTHSMGSNHIHEMKWRRPVLAGDVLRGVLTLVDKRVSASKPDTGIFTMQVHLLDAAGELRTEMSAICFMRVRPAC